MRTNKRTSLLLLLLLLFTAGSPKTAEAGTGDHFAGAALVSLSTCLVMNGFTGWHSPWVGTIAGFLGGNIANVFNEATQDFRGDTAQDLAEGGFGAAAGSGACYGISSEMHKRAQGEIRVIGGASRGASIGLAIDL